MEKSEKVIETVKFNPFTATDWMGFAGAENFSDGAEPLIGYLEVDGFDAIAILDGAGLHVSWDIPVEADEDEDGEEVLHEETETIGFSFPNAYATRALAALRPEMTLIVLKRLPGSVAA